MHLWLVLGTAIVADAVCHGLPWGPIVIRPLRAQAATALPVLEERRREVTTQLGQQLGRLGHGFVASTHDLFEQVCDMRGCLTIVVHACDTATAGAVETLESSANMTSKVSGQRRLSAPPAAGQRCDPDGVERQPGRAAEADAARGGGARRRVCCGVVQVQPARG